MTNRFKAAVPTVEKFPLPIMILGSVMLLFGFFITLLCLFKFDTIVPELAAGVRAQAVGLQVVGRNSAPIIVLFLAMLGKNVRFMQLAWGLAIVRETCDALCAILQADYGGLLMVLSILAIEIVVFVYLEAMATGRIAKYKAN